MRLFFGWIAGILSAVISTPLAGGVMLWLKQDYEFDTDQYVADLLRTLTSPWDLSTDLSMIAVAATLAGCLVGYLVWYAITKSSTELAPSSIRLTVGETGSYLDTEGGVYGIRRTFNLKVENVDQREPLSNCTIRILSISPSADEEGPWTLRERLTLAAGEHAFLPLVTYGEAREPNIVRGDTFMTMGTDTQRPYLDVGPEYTLTLRATAPETAFYEYQCRVWIDGNGRLRIAEA